MNTLENLKAEAKKLTELAAEGKATETDVERLDTIIPEIRQAKAAQDGEALLSNLTSEGTKSMETRNFKTLGDHFIESVSGKSLDAAGVHSRATFKAADTPLALGESLGTTQELGLVGAPEWSATVAGLFAQGRTDKTSVSYLVQGAWEGNFAGVAENTRKPYMSTDFTEREDKLGKIAGLLKETTEFAKDRKALADAINQRLFPRLSQEEERQLIAGTGLTGEIDGLLNRSGLLTRSAASNDPLVNLETLFRAKADVLSVSGFKPSAILLNPEDYNELLLAKDANNQYYLGGPASNAYGNANAVADMLWKLPVVTSSFVPQGTAVVGAFNTQGMVFRNGNVETEVATTNVDDFEYNRVTVRAEERVGLAIYTPSAFVRVSLFNGA